MMKKNNFLKKAIFKISLLVLMCFSFMGFSQPPKDPFYIYNTTNCDIIVHIEYWARGCPLSTPCYHSGPAGDFIAAGGSFLIPGCAPAKPDDIYVTLDYIGGNPIPFPNAVGWTGSACISGQVQFQTGSIPPGTSCTSATSWNMQYNPPPTNNVTIW